MVLVCIAQALVQLGAFFWPDLLPRMIALWGLSYSEAGWITAAFYGAYILAVPFLVTLTDRLDPKLVYLSGVALTVVGHFCLASSPMGSGRPWPRGRSQALAGPAPT